MTIEGVCKEFNISDIGDFSDGYHTFNELYHQRAVLFATIVNQNKDIAWKSYRHEDGELCFGGGWFIVGVDTPEGSYTYHYENKYWDIFECKELERSKHWDGHTDKDVTRLLSLPTMTNHTIETETVDHPPSRLCEKCGRIVFWDSYFQDYVCCCFVDNGIAENEVVEYK